MRQKCVDRFRDIYLLKVRKSLSRHTRQNAIRYGSCNNIANNKVFVGKVSRLFGNIPDSLESFHTVWKLSTLSVNFPHFQKNFRLSGNFPNQLETFQTIWKPSRRSGNFPERLETFQSILKLSRPSGNFPDQLESLQTVRKLSKLSGNLPNCLKTFQTVLKLSTLVSLQFS